MILLKIIGLFLCFGFVAFFWRLSSVASAMTDFCDSVPRGEGWEEEDESSVDDPVQFRVVSADWEPIELERQ